jgi:hypothetical protein
VTAASTSASGKLGLPYHASSPPSTLAR